MVFLVKRNRRRVVKVTGFSSLYTIGGYYYGQFGKSYRLYGQEKSNSNALKRLIVLHGHISVPDTEQTAPIHNSYGCPMVSPQFFGQLVEIIDQSTKKITLMIYY